METGYDGNRIMPDSWPRLGQDALKVQPQTLSR